MNRSSSAGSGGRIVTIVAVVALAIVVLALVVFALRTPEVRDEGETPPIGDISLTPSASPSPPPSPVTGKNDPQLLSIGSEGSGIRSSEGDCLGSSGLVETTDDDGLTWAPIAFADVPVRQILSVTSPDAGQIDVLAKVGAACAVTMVSSFTDGAFWQEYPDRIAEALYIDPIDPGTIHNRGTSLTAPCAVDQVVGAPVDPVVLCNGQIQAFDSGSAGWRVLVESGATSIGFDESGGLLVVTAQGAPDCAGTQISSIATAAGSIQTPITCFESEVQPRFVTVARDGSTIWYWSDSGSQVSADGGSTWSRGN